MVMSNEIEIVLHTCQPPVFWTDIPEIYRYQRVVVLALTLVEIVNILVSMRC